MAITIINFGGFTSVLDSFPSVAVHRVFPLFPGTMGTPSTANTSVMNYLLESIISTQ